MSLWPTQLMDRGRSLQSDSYSGNTDTSRIFLESEGSLRWIKYLATGSYSYANELRPHPPTILILSFHLHLGIPSGLSPWAFWFETLYRFSSLSFMLHDPPISFPLVWSSWYLGFEVLTEVIRKSSVFWDITQCSPFRVSRSFRGTFRLRLHGWRVSQARNEHVARSKKSFVD
jgi:hypothetical protein